MKKYKKAKVVAKNNPQGAYSAGCPTNMGLCNSSCETRK
jgi:hypothetical protein